MTCLKRLNKAGLELRPESTALAVHCLLPLVELCWAWGRGSGFHTRVRAQNPDGPVGRGRSGEREGGVAQRLLVGCRLQGEDPLPPLRVHSHHCLCRHTMFGKDT